MQEEIIIRWRNDYEDHDAVDITDLSSESKAEVADLVVDAEKRQWDSLSSKQTSEHYKNHQLS